MATMGTVEVLVKVDSSRVLDVLNALSTLVCIVESYDHVWTTEELTMLDAARAACERKNLAAETP